jgi:hypothetical protein
MAAMYPETMMTPNVRLTREEVCEEIPNEVMDMAGWLAGEDLSPEHFRLALVRLEERKLTRFGLKMTSFASPDGLVHFTLRFADTDEFCASMDIDPLTGEMTLQRGCS